MRTIIMCSLVVLCGCSQPAEDADFPLVTVQVKDAPFVRVPDSVTIFASSPQSRFSSKPLMLDAPSVRVFEESDTIYCVTDVSSYNERLGTEFADGDVLYVYTCDSKLAERQLLGNHELRRVNAPDKYGGVYEIRPHVFAEVRTNRSIEHFLCMMHPQINVGQARVCPVCGMELAAVAAEQEGETADKKVAFDRELVGNGQADE